MSKGEQTKSVIVAQSLDLASVVGLNGLSIGALAEHTGMSKSGLFAHFGSKEALQRCSTREENSSSGREARHQSPRGIAPAHLFALAQWDKSWAGPAAASSASAGGVR
jgi:hypothetical protein